MDLNEKYQQNTIGDNLIDMLHISKEGGGSEQYFEMINDNLDSDIKTQQRVM